MGCHQLTGVGHDGHVLIGFLAAIGSAVLMKFFVRARERDFFIMELPVYRVPRWKNIGSLL